MAEDFLRAAWPAPDNVHCVVTTRRGGVSAGPWASFNLGSHVDDERAHVLENRRRLIERLGVSACHWIRQVHGTRVADAVAGGRAETPDADALYTAEPDLCCGILTADCLPVAFCDREGREVCVAHAGWRGLCAGVLENALARFQAPPDRIIAWLGPAIGPCHFEVGEEVRAAFLAAAGSGTRAETATAFRPGAASGKWMADLYAIARARLRAAGVALVHGGGRCTYCEADTFYSYRREPVTGRFATLIWRTGVGGSRG